MHITSHGANKKITVDLAAKTANKALFTLNCVLGRFTYTVKKISLKKL